MEITQGQEKKNGWLVFNFGFQLELLTESLTKNLLLDKESLNSLGSEDQEHLLPLAQILGILR